MPDLLPAAWIVDIDGTLALMNGRGPYDWHRVGEDAPNLPVIRVTQALMMAGLGIPGDQIIYVSGRMEQCREGTRDWLHRHVCGDSAITCSCDSPLFMRADGDYRPDEQVKREIYERGIAGRFGVMGVIDDRARVVSMWRSLGLTCLQAADGNF